MFNLYSLKPDEIIIYLRKSRTDDPALTVSDVLSRHEQMLDEWCIRTLGDTVPQQNRFREVVSGETIEARPEMKKVLHLIEQDRFKAILIVEPQRLSRGDLEDIGRISKILRYTHTIVITLQYSYDLQDERDRDYFERELKRGNEYLEYSKRIMQNGIRASIERGAYVASKPPYGYKRIKIKEGKRYLHTLEIIPEEAEMVRLIFQRYAAGIGAQKIIKELETVGAPLPHMSGKWQPDIIYHILDNPHYIGKIKWNARKKTIIVEDGEIRKSRPRTEPEVYEGMHEAIISDEVWDAVRAAREQRHLPKTRSSFDLQNPLAGLMYCAECGAAVRFSVPAGRSRRYYCPNQAKCGNASCMMDIIVNDIKEAIRAEIADRKVKVEDISGSSDELTITSNKITMLRIKIEKLKEKQDALWEKYAEGMPKDTFERLLAKNEADAAEATEMLSDALRVAESITSAEDAETSLYAALDTLDDESAPAKEVNALMKAIIKRIEYRRKPPEKAQSGGNGGGWKTYEPELTIEFLV